MDRKEMMAALRKDRRSAGQVFESLRQELISFSDGTISEEEATKAARNLIGLFETALEIPSDKRSFQLDESQDER